MSCSNCGYEEIPCGVSDCDFSAMYEGWYRVVDFAGIPTGLIQLRSVCEEHKTMLIGGQKEESESIIS